MESIEVSVALTGPLAGVWPRIVDTFPRTDRVVERAVKRGFVKNGPLFVSPLDGPS